MRSNFTFLFLLMVIACLSQFSSDVYAPALPSIAHDLNTPINYVQQSMAVYMLGIALVQLVYGVLSEAYGRRKPLILGLMIMLVGSVLCLFANSVFLLLLGRFIQGCGAGACNALWRSMFRDRFSGDQLAKYGSYLTILVSFFIPAAPVVGGYLEQFIGWRSIFVFITIYVLISVVIAIFMLQETHQDYHKDKLKVSFIKENIVNLLRNKSFMGYTLCTFLVYGAFFTLYIVTPVLLIKHIGMSASEYGWSLLSVSLVATLISGLFNGKLVERVGASAMLRVAFILILLSSFGMLISGYYMSQQAFPIIINMFIFQLGSMLVFPNIFSKAFHSVGHIAGYASGVYALIQIGGAAVIGTLASHLPDKTAIPLALLIMVAGSLAWAIIEMLSRRIVGSSGGVLADKG